MVKLSIKLSLVTAITTLGLIIFWIGRVYGTDCFNFFDYGVSFGTLFINMMINLLAAFGK